VEKMKKSVSYQDFPVTKQTDNIKIWEGLNIEQNGKINIGKNEEIYESRIYPFKEGKQRIKVLSKINTETNRITFVISSGQLLTEENTVSVKSYHKLMQDLEQDMINHIDVDQKNFITGKQIQNQIAQKS